jgi:uncharacterized peroxidase-related enzyme
MSDEIFVKHTPESAPVPAGAFLSGAQKQFGFIPEPMTRMAAAPALIEAFMKANQVFEASTAFSPLEREVIVMTISLANDCHYCMAMHSAVMTRMELPRPIIEALRAGEKLDDAKLEALADFTRRVLEGRGQVADAQVHAFLAAGYTTRHALETVLAAGVYALTTYANRLTKAALDPAF